MFDIGADHGGGILRPQRERSAVAILEGVHLLGDDIGFFADAAREKLRLFENRRADFVVVVRRKTPRAAASTWFQTSLDGGRMSRVPLTARITIVLPYKAPCF